MGMFTTVMTPFNDDGVQFEFGDDFCQVVSIGERIDGAEGLDGIECGLGCFEGDSLVDFWVVLKDGMVVAVVPSGVNREFTRFSLEHMYGLGSPKTSQMVDKCEKIIDPFPWHARFWLWLKYLPPWGGWVKRRWAKKYGWQYALPLLRTVWPTLTMDKVVSVEPMNERDDVVVE